MYCTWVHCPDNTTIVNHVLSNVGIPSLEKFPPHCKRNPFSVVTTIRHHESMQNSSLHLLLINLCFANLLTSFLVKPISAIYTGYSISTGIWQVIIFY